MTESPLSNETPLSILVVDDDERTNPDEKRDWYAASERRDGDCLLKPGVVSEANEEDDIANRKANIEPQVKALLTNMLEGGDVTLEDGVQEKRPNTANR